MIKKSSFISIIIGLIGIGLFALQQPQPIDHKKPVRVYVDMVGDLFHYGHVEMLRKAKELGDVLIVGVCSDEDVASYKRTPILSMEERVRSVKGCKYVDEVYGNCPLVVTKEWIEKLQIDLVVHGDDQPQEWLEKYYKVPMEMGIFRTVPYTPDISTTELLNRIIKRLVLHEGELRLVS